MLHGCRQLVSRDVGLSPATSATLVFSCHHLVGHSKETAANNAEEGGDDVKSSWPLRPGLHTCYNGRHKGSQERKLEPIPKSALSSDRGLQPDLVKVESLVIADQNAAVNTFPGLVHTARQATKGESALSRLGNRKELSV